MEAERQAVELCKESKDIRSRIAELKKITKGATIPFTFKG